MGAMKDSIPSTGPVRTLVYPSISHAEFGRLLQKYGYDAEPVHEKGRIGYRTLTQPRFTAWLQTPFDLRPGEFAAVFLFVCGGITEYYLRNQLWHWMRDLKRLRVEVRKQTRLLAGSTVH
jgi:hypothetical protein